MRSVSITIWSTGITHYFRVKFLKTDSVSQRTTEVDKSDYENYNDTLNPVATWLYNGVSPNIEPTP